MKKVKLIIPIILIIALGIPALLIIFGKDTAFSQNENRYLKKRQDLVPDGLLDGSFQRDFQDWLSDQFPNRDNFMGISSLLKYGLGRRDLNGVYIGKDGYLFNKYTDEDVDRKQLSANLSRIDKLSEAFPDTKASLILVPDSGTVLGEYLPDNAVMYDSKRLLEECSMELGNVTLINSFSRLSKLGKGAYFKTDHHWTLMGAYAAYQEYMKDEGSFDKDEYPFKILSQDFWGSLYSKTLLPNQPGDAISAVDFDEEVPAFIDGQESSIYDMTYVDAKDKYSVFFGGNHGLVEIPGKGKGTLLVIKDSFANCFVSFLTGDFETILMVDPRFFPGSVKNLIKNRNVDEILFLFGMSGFWESTDLAKLSM